MSARTEVRTEVRKRVQAPRNRYSGTVGVCTPSATGRFTAFQIALANLERPPGWTVENSESYSETRNRNFFAENFQGEWLWFIDDDHWFRPDTLRRLLAHNRLIVAPLCLQRKAPFELVALKEGKPYRLDDEPGLVEVDATGTAGMLIHRRVFDKLERPYFFHDDGRDGAETSDVLFCRSAREAGFAIHVDTSLSIEHLNVMGVTPRFEDGRWFRSLRVGQEEVARF